MKQYLQVRAVLTFVTFADLSKNIYQQKRKEEFIFVGKGTLNKFKLQYVKYRQCLSGERLRKDPGQTTKRQAAYSDLEYI